jgi:hypothetical protein
MRLQDAVGAGMIDDRMKRGGQAVISSSFMVVSVFDFPLRAKLVSPDALHCWHHYRSNIVPSPSDRISMVRWMRSIISRQVDDVMCSWRRGLLLGAVVAIDLASLHLVNIIRG